MQSDEALFALMAKHIVSRGDFPVFAYGEERSGVLISYLVAPFFYLFGASNLVFKTVTTVLSLVLAFMLYSLARRIGGNRFGLLAMALSVFGPAFLIMWSVHAAAEYMIMMLCGVGSLLLCDNILFKDRSLSVQSRGQTLAADAAKIDYGLLGLVLGIGFWVSPLIVSFIMGVWLALFLRDRRCFLRLSFLVFLMAFLLGNLPAILFNILPDLRLMGGMPDAPNWISYTSLLSGSTEPLWSRVLQVPGTLVRVAMVSMPPMVGGSLWEYETVLWRRLVVVILVGFWFLAALHVFVRRVTRLLGSTDTDSRAQLLPQRWALQRIDPLILQFLSALLVFSLSPYRWLVSEPRYLIPIFAFLLVAGAGFLDWLWSRKRVVGTAALVLVVVLNVGTTVAFSEGLDPDHGLWPEDEQMMQHLIENDIRHPVADYWNAYSIAFETDEQVIPVPIGYLKYSMYEDLVTIPPRGYYLFPKRTRNDRYFEFFRYGLAGPQWTARGFRDYLDGIGVPEQAFTEFESEHYVLYEVPTEILDPADVILARIDPPGASHANTREQLASIIGPGDGLILNPPELLARLGGGQIEEFAAYKVPERSPLDEATVSNRLTRMATEHPRLYLLLGDTSASDPGGYVQGWLNRNAYRAGDQWIDDLLLVLYGTTATAPAREPTEFGEVVIGDWVELVGAEIPQDGVKPGEIVPVTLFWQAVKLAPGDVKVFVHLLNANGDLVAQRDSGPVGGLRPTSGWEAEEAIEDRYGVQLPRDLPAGDYQVAVGLYQPATGDRLPIRVEGAVSPSDSYEIGSISVQR
jgi:4-amino-4-deoxy-L-arabinose transferase-like glycosyltransferase